MVVLNKKEKTVTSERIASYAVLTNNDGKIAVVRHKGWGLILPGGKKEKDESGDQTIIRETLEEIGYEVDELRYYETFEMGTERLRTHNPLCTQHCKLRKKKGELTSSYKI